MTRPPLSPCHSWKQCVCCPHSIPSKKIRVSFHTLSCDFCRVCIELSSDSCLSHLIKLLQVYDDDDVIDCDVIQHHDISFSLN